MPRYKDYASLPYQKTWSWPPSVERFLVETIREAPLLNVCSGRTCFGHVRVDAHHPDATVKADWLKLPFTDNSFAAIFCDPPWYANYMKDCGTFMREALRIAPIIYLMAPWTWGAARAVITDTWIRHQVGVKQPLFISRYERRGYEFNKRQFNLYG